MLFRYDFGEKLDLSKFRKQISHYSKYQSEYQIVMSHFMMIIRFELGQRILVATFDVGKDSDGNIIQRSPIYLGLDDRFRDFKDVQVFTENWKHGCEFEQHIQNLDQTVEQICGLIKILHKINGLKAFL